jgi:ParB-like chromosome segregation protein Spo0J
VVDRKMVVIVGHTRLMAARMLGHQMVPVLVATDLTPKQVKAYRLADNRTGEEADWDMALLSVEIGDLREAGFDLAVTGFDRGELGKLRLDESSLAGKERKLSDNLQFQVVVDCANEADQAGLIARLTAEKRKCRPLTL